MTFAQHACTVFNQVIQDYHINDDIDTPMTCSLAGVPDVLLYEKCWVDTVQWHLEDIIRDPEIDPMLALNIKRRIDRSNQIRTDLVEALDDYFMQEWATCEPPSDARINTETPAWAVDRLSILCLKIYHMRIEANRTDVDDHHRLSTSVKLQTLENQRVDLTEAIDQLLADIQTGRVAMRLYRQMKMYNDPSLNPVLYNQRSQG